MFDRKYFEETKIVKKRIIFESNKKEKKDSMHICFNIDFAFFRPTGVTITSILEQNQSMEFAFHIFTDNISEKDIAAVQKTAEKYHCDMYIYIMDMAPFANFHIKHDRFKRVSYFRLYVAKVLKSVTRYFLYLDADLICIGDMDDFRKIDLKGYPIAAVTDLSGAVKMRAEYLKLTSGAYFNSGVLWIDAELWDKQEITERCFSWQGVEPKRFTCHDQDVLNLTMDGKVQFLSKKFNFLGRMDVVPPSDCVIYHFFGREKPWDVVLTKYDRLWRKYNELSFWDTITDELLIKEPQHYHNYKFAGKYYKRHGQPLKSLQCYFWYTVLKIKKNIWQ